MADEADPGAVKTDETTFGGIKISHAGMIVFVFASVALVLLVIYSVIFDLDEASMLRGAESILTIAGLGIIISFLLSAKNVVIVTITLLVVAALVIPSRDIVRFVLVSTGSDRSLEDFYGRSGVSSNITSRVDDIALEIVDELEKALHQDDLAPFSLEQRQRLAQSIGDVIQRDRTFTLYERVNARGVLELLSAIMDGQASDFIYRYRDVDRLEDDLRYLRYEGLVSIAYDDLDSINITPLGRAVVEVSRATDEIVAELPLLFEGRQFSPDCTRISQVALSSATVRDIDDLVAEPIAFDVVSEAAPEFVLIHALGGFVGDYEFNFTHEPMPLEENALVFPMLDPRMTLYRIYCAYAKTRNFS